MLIMSQNKNDLFNTDRIIRIYINNPCGRSGAEIWADVGSSDEYIFGSYATKTRAEEVLRMVYNLWHMGAAHFEMPEE